VGVWVFLGIVLAAPLSLSLSHTPITPPLSFSSSSSSSSTSTSPSTPTYPFPRTKGDCKQVPEKSTEQDVLLSGGHPGGAGNIGCHHCAVDKKDNNYHNIYHRNYHNNYHRCTWEVLDVNVGCGGRGSLLVIQYNTSGFFQCLMIVVLLSSVQNIIFNAACLGTTNCPLP
jgi:hypothetical protein